MKGYVARKGERWYAVIYEGLDPVTGRERRTWHAAGTNRTTPSSSQGGSPRSRTAEAEAARSLTFGAYLTRRWLPAKRVQLQPSTWDGYRRKIELHILPTLGRHRDSPASPDRSRRLYERKLRPTDGSRALSPKSVLEIHQIIRGALGDAHRQGLVSRNIALVATTPKLARASTRRTQALDRRGAPGVPSYGRRASAIPAFWIAAHTGMRRSEVLGLQWRDIDFDTPPSRSTGPAVDRLREVRVHAARPHAAAAASTSARQRWTCCAAGDDWRQAAAHATGVPMSKWVFADGDGEPVHPQRSRRPSTVSLPTPGSPSSGCTTSATPTPPCS